MQPVAITGVTGFIGRHVARELMQRGLRWRGLVRSRDKLAALNLSGGEITEGRLADAAALGRFCEGAKAVIHCGGSIAGYSRWDFMRVNVEGTASLVAACQRSQVKRLIHVSSLAAREPQLSPYAESKAESEKVLQLSGAGISWAIVRPPAVYGPGDQATIPLIRTLIRPIAFMPGDATSRLSLIHVRDLAKALVSLALTDAVHGGTFEIDDGKQGGYDFGEMAATAAAVTGIRTRVIFLPRSMLIVPAWCSLILGWLQGTPRVLSPGKLGELYHRNWVVNPGCSDIPGWRARIDFSTGFTDTLKWYREHGWLPEGHIRPEPGGVDREGGIRP
jgi:nucleoside-diphosphate-sugar epimerase